MSSEKSLTPQIRFKGFTEAWEQRKLGNIAAFSKGQGFSKSNLTNSGSPVILYGRLYTNYETQICKVDTFVKSSSCGVLSKGGEVIVPASGETAEDIAVASHVSLPGILLGGDLNIVTPKDNLDSNFLALFITFGNAHVELSKRAQGKSVVHVRNGDLSQLNIKYPTRSEQILISNLFIKNDNLITLHQRKLDALKKIKSALLEKMFPKDGSNIPEIRFAGFTEAWEQRKLSDVAEIIGGGTPDTNNPSYWDGDIDWYSPAELGEQIYTIGSRRRITKEGYKNSSAKLLPANKTILFTSRAGIGTTAILCRSACTNQGFQSLVISDNTDLYFIYSMSSRIKGFAISKASGSTFLEISGKQLAAMSLFLPQLNEQRKIGQYFKSLDNLITLHQRKLDALKKIKSALLEKMFV